MVSGTTTLDEAAVLAAARGARNTANLAEAEVLRQAVEWARLHEACELADAATWPAGHGRDTGIPIAGEGAPLVSQFAVLEFATALGLSAESGRNLVAHAMELAHRLPKTWARVLAGSLAPWRARRIAEETLCLSVEAAAFVDAQVAPFAHRTGPAQTQRLVEDAIARFMPDFARERREQAAEGRHFDIDHQQVSFSGTSRVHGELDLDDALDLEDAIRKGAADLAALGSDDTLDVRRAKAAGLLARGQRALPLDTQTPRQAETHAREPKRREVVLFVHLSADALRNHDQTQVALVQNAGGRLVTTDQVAAWCAGPTVGSGDCTKVTVKPVVDLNATLTSPGYQPSPRLAEQVRLRDRTCVHPYCNRPARSCDLDHIDPYDPDGAAGQTNTMNLACLCRAHHRLKTHGGWVYTMVRPGTYLWRSPYGHTWLRDPAGTTDLTPPLVEPPER